MGKEAFKVNNKPPTINDDVVVVKSIHKGKRFKTPQEARVVDINDINPALIKKRPARKGTVALREIKALQKSVNLLIRKKSFSRCVREIARDIKPDIRFAKSSIEAIQTSVESFITEMFSKSYVLAGHSKRQEIQLKDLFAYFKVTNQPHFVRNRHL
jgi:histone H3/H4